jgi:hypothetical protein
MLPHLLHPRSQSFWILCFGQLNLFRNWGPARRVGSPKDQFRALDFEFYAALGTNALQLHNAERYAPCAMRYAARTPYA